MRKATKPCEDCNVGAIQCEAEGGKHETIHNKPEVGAQSVRLRQISHRRSDLTQMSCK